MAEPSARVKISALPVATLPLSGTETMVVVQGGVTKQTPVSGGGGSSGVSSFNTRTGVVTLTSADVTTALTYTPTSVTGLTGVRSVAAFKTGLTLVKADVGLGNVDNTSDAAKPVSTATQTALNLKADLASPGLTGTPTAPTATAGTNTAQLATTAFVTTAVASGGGGVTSFNTRTGAVTLTSGDVTTALTYTPANIASPTFTGTPAGPTATGGTNTTQLATTAFVQSAIAGGTAGVASFNTRTGIVTLTSGDVTTALTYTPVSNAAVIDAAHGGTGQSSYAIGDLLQASASTTLSKLASVATGNVLISGGVTTVSSWGKVGLTTHVSGTLPVANGGTGITSLGTGVATALGVNVGSAGAFVTFNGALGTPSSGTLSNCTVDGTSAVGFREIPQNSQSTAYTAVLADNGKHILHPIGDNNARTFTIPANSSVAYPVGTCISFVNMINTVTIAITTDTMYLAGAGTTGSRTLAAYGTASAIKITSTSWIISGSGLT